jgi:hypothetical protein
VQHSLVNAVPEKLRNGREHQQWLRNKLLRMRVVLAEVRRSLVLVSLQDLRVPLTLPVLAHL